MQIELHRNPQGGFTITDAEGNVLDQSVYFHQARIKAMSISREREGCVIVSRVDDDVPATETAATTGRGVWR